MRLLLLLLFAAFFLSCIVTLVTFGLVMLTNPQDKQAAQACVASFVGMIIFGWMIELQFRWMRKDNL